MLGVLRETQILQVHCQPLCLVRVIVCPEMCQSKRFLEFAGTRGPVKVASGTHVDADASDIGEEGQRVPQNLDCRWTALVVDVCIFFRLA